MTPIGNKTAAGAASTSVDSTSTKKQTPVDGKYPPSRAKSDPSSTASTINKVTKPDTGKIGFGNKFYEAALIKEVNSLRGDETAFDKGA